MSLAADPNQKFEYVLKSDRELEKEKQPVFEFRYLTVRLWRKMVTLSNEFAAAKGSAEIVDAAVNINREILAGWKNVKDANGNEITFDIEKLEDILVPGDITELAGAGLLQSADSEDKKKLDSPSPSDSDSSAKDAPA